MDLGRKRLFSGEHDGLNQRKFFVTQKMVDQKDKNKMQKIYGKKQKLRQK